MLAPGGLLYTITDVEELGAWMQAKLEAHPAFIRVPEAQLEVDPAAQLLVSATEEGQKVARNGGQVRIFQQDLLSWPCFSHLANW